MLRSLLRPIGQTSATTKISRSFAAKFKRTKPHLNVGTIGHIDHGKTTLTSAITKIASESGSGSTFFDYKSIDKAPEEQSRGITISTTTLEYETAVRHYGHVDCPGHEDYVKNMITGAAKMDCGILLVAAPDGAKPQTREHILLCKQVGVKKIIIFINKVDLEPDEMLHELVEDEVKEILQQYGFNPDESPCVKGSALAALENRDPEIGKDRIIELLNIMDSEIPLSTREVDLDFKMSIESTYNIEGRGTVVVGTVEAGKIKPGDAVELVGFSKDPIPSTITAIETFRKSLDYAEAGDNVGFLLRGVTRDQVRRGMIMAKPGVYKTGNCFEAQIYYLKEDEGGRGKGFSSGFRPQLFLRTADVAADIILPENVKVGMPGDNLTCQIRIDNPLPIEKGLRFALRESKKTIGHGVISKVYIDNCISQGVGRKMKTGNFDFADFAKKLEEKI